MCSMNKSALSGSPPLPCTGDNLQKKFFTFIIFNCCYFWLFCFVFILNAVSTIFRFMFILCRRVYSMTMTDFYWPLWKSLLCVGRTSLSLALGNMAVARQILLIFNLSYLPCFVQFVNKNYCQAKKQSFYDLLMPLFCA